MLTWNPIVIVLTSLLLIDTINQIIFSSFSDFIIIIFSHIDNMVVDSSSSEVTYRRRNLPVTSAEPFTAENSDKDSSDRNSSDGEFDTDVSTLNPIVAEELIETTHHLPHDAALEKLKEVGAKTPILPSEIGTDFSYKREIVWPNAIGFLALHICALIGVLLVMFGYSNYKTVIYSKYKQMKFCLEYSDNSPFFEQLSSLCMDRAWV